MSTVRVYQVKAEVQRTGAAVTPATVRIYEARAQIAAGPPPVGATAKVRIFEVKATITTGAAPTPNPAKFRIYEVKAKITPGGPRATRTGVWASAGGSLVPVRTYAASELP